MSKREKHDKKPHIVRDEPTPAEVAQDVAVGDSLAPLDAEPPKFGPAWLGAPRVVPTQPVEVDAGPLTTDERRLIGRLESAYADDAKELVAFMERQRASRSTADSEWRCTTCGNPVAPGAACAVDGQIAVGG